MLHLVNTVRNGPLTLQQLARIAVRRAVGGSHFAPRIVSLKKALPISLFDYVADPMKNAF